MRFLTIGLYLIGSLFNFAHAETPVLTEETFLNLDWLNKNIEAKEDFFSFANGNWQKQNPIPEEYASWGSFNILQNRILDRLHALLIAASEDKNATPGSIEQKVGDFYYSGMDEKEINRLGKTPLDEEFKRIKAISNNQQLEDEIAHLQLLGLGAPFNFGSMQDFKNSEDMIAAAFQGGLSLPDRDYYLNTDKKFAEIREAHQQHIENMFILLGDDKAKASLAAKTVMHIETELAKASLSQVEQRDPNAIYHMMNLNELEKISPHFSWQKYLNNLQLKDVKQLNLAMPNFFKRLNELLVEIPLQDWQTYLSWQLIDSYASYLSSDFVDEDFKMTAKLSGAKKLQPRWKRVVSTENGALGFAVGKLYVEKYFPPEAKQQVLNMIADIRKTFKKELENVSWMTEQTRQNALKKLARMKERVGYPDKWRDYSSLKVDRGPYVLNVMRANEFLSRRELNKIGKPIDKSEWAMTPQTVNAYYDPSMNNLNIPAGILQSPFFEAKAPAAVNFGSIGFVIGHEMTHGFDDQGAKFDANGNLNNWWTETDLKRFKAATNCIIEQFSKYKVNGDLPVQGKLVVGEATADLGGLTLAYKAFLNSDYYKKAKTIQGFTPEQQFFLGTAHVWAANIRPEQARNLVTTDPHPPMIYRVNGTLANMPEFKKAFNISEKSPMVNEKLCVIW